MPKFKVNLGKVTFREFQPSMIYDGRVFLSIGGYVGETFDMLRKGLLENMPAAGLVVDSSATGELGKLVHPKFIQNGYCKDDLIGHLKFKIASAEWQRKLGLPVEKTFLVLNENFKHDDMTLRRLAMNGVCYGVSPLLLAPPATPQYRPAVRNQIEWVFIHPAPRHNSKLRILYMNFCEGIGPFELFCAVMHKLCFERGTLVVRNTSTSWDVKENFYVWCRHLDGAASDSI